MGTVQNEINLYILSASNRGRQDIAAFRKEIHNEELGKKSDIITMCAFDAFINDDNSSGCRG